MARDGKSIQTSNRLQSFPPAVPRRNRILGNVPEVSMFEAIRLIRQQAWSEGAAAGLAIGFILGLMLAVLLGVEP